MPVVAEVYFMFATMLIAVPTGIKIFNWVATMFKGSLSFEAPMLFAISFLIMFTFGGLSGLMLSIAPCDFMYHDTYFVVAHFHYVLIPGAIFGINAGVYYWFPKWTGRMYSETLAKFHFWLTFISLNVTFFPMHFLGLAGMPRRIPDYALQFTDFNMISSVAAFVYGLTQFLWLYILLKALISGKRIHGEVWAGAKSLEWTVPTPAPYHTFQTPPKMI